MYCTDCHATETTGDGPFSTAPRFCDLHLHYDFEFLGEALAEDIVTAHPQMPQFEFDRIRRRRSLLTSKHWTPRVRRRLVICGVVAASAACPSHS